MGGQDTDSVTFIGMNFILIAVVGLLIFGYFLLLIRKRWREGFMHKSSKKEKSE